jgi:diguanylate cyclase (GGDEF)-like protein
MDGVLAGRAAQDPRQQAATMAVLLFSGAGLSSLSLIWLLPPSVNQPLAYLMSGITFVSALGVRLLPWQRWPERAIWVLPVLGLSQVLLAGGVLDDSMEYYGLFLPLAFVFVGWVFSVGGTLRYAALTLAAAVPAIGFGVETRQVTPFFLLGVATSVACGVVVAVGRRTEARTIDAMGQLMEAAILLGGARTEAEVSEVVSRTMRRLVAADTATLELGRTEIASPADPRVLSLQVVSTDGRPSATITASFGKGAAEPDGLSVRMAELLATETGRVLERLQATAALTALSRTDPLTGLGNRLELGTALERMRPGDCVVLCDLDHFKLVNDAIGHAGGDEVLAAFSDELREVVREGDTAVRYGGEEFAIVLTATTADGARAVLARLRHRWAANAAMTTFSSGIAVHGEGVDVAVTVERADRALYQAKADGRNRDVVHETVIEVRSDPSDRLA